MPAISTAFGQGTNAARPAASSSNNGYYWFSSDTGGGTLYQSNGSSWVQLAAGVNFGTWSWATKTSAYTITTADTGILVDTTSGALTVTLPTAVGATQQYTIAKKTSDANKVTLATTSAQTINGVSTKTLSLQDDVMTVASDGSNWRIAHQALGDVAQLDYAASSDINNGTSISATTWTDVGTNQTFTVDDANSLVEMAVSGNVVGPAGNASMGSRIVIDSAGTPTNKMLGGNYVGGSGATANANFLAGADVVTLTGLSAGSHTVKVQIYSSITGTFYCRPATNPNQETLQIRAIERKR